MPRAAAGNKIAAISKVMKHVDLMPALEKGEPMMLAKYFVGELQTIEIRNKTNGQARKAYIARETVLTAKNAVAVTRFLKDNEDPLAWKPSAKQGALCVVRITGFEVDRGNIKVSGMVEPVE
jgi:hypothetical protein